MSNNPIRIFLVDDSPYFLDVAREFLQYQNALTVVGVASDAEAAVTQALALAPDVILLDLNLERSSGLRLIPVFKAQLPTAKVIILTIMEESGYRTAAMMAGADAFVHKSAMTQTLVTAILDVVRQEDGEQSSGQAAARSLPPGERSTNCFERLVEHVPDLIYRYEFVPQRGFAYVSPSATAMTGYTAEEHYADPDLGFKLIHPEDRHLLERLSHDAIEPLAPLELRWVRKDGTILWTEQRNVHIHDAAGGLVAIEGIARDITAHKKADEAVLASERFAHQTIDALTVGIAILDEAGTIVAVNGPWREFAEEGGIDPALVSEGVDYLAVCDRATGKDAETARPVADAIRALIAGDTVPHVIEYPCHSATERRWFEARISRFNDAGPVRIVVTHANITERRRAGDALRASEERFRATFEQAAIGIAHVATDGRWLLVNDRLCAITGYTREELLARSFQDITFPDDLPADLEQMHRLLAGAIKSYNLEKRYIRKDGSRVWINLTVALVRNTLDEPEYFISVIQDISQRKQAQETLRQSEARYRALFEQSNDAVFILDLQGRHIMANRRASDMLGYAPEEIGALSYREVSAQLDQSERVLSKLLAGQHIPTYEAKFRRKNGEVFPVDINVELVRNHDGSPLHIQSVVRDIAERIRAEETLRLQSSALEATANAIVITDVHGAIQWVNSAWTLLTGYVADDALGKSMRILKSGWQSTAFYADLWTTILSGEPWHGELINRRKDGSLYTEEQTITPIVDRNGVITHFVGVKQDVSERIQAAEQIRRQVVQLATLHEIDQAIASNLDLSTLLSLLLSRTVELLASDAAAIHLVSDDGVNLEFAAGAGFRSNDVGALLPAFGPDDAGITAAATSRIFVPDLATLADNATVRSLHSNEGFVAYASAPLIVKEKVIGVLELFDRSTQARDEAWFDILDTLAGQAAIAVENARLFSTAQRELEERRRAEADLRFLNKELEERVEARTADLRRLNIELAHAVRVKDEFLANMSHELRTPISAILGLSELLAGEIPGVLNEKQQRYVGIVSESGSHLLALINDILDIAKSEAGLLELKFSGVDVSAVCLAATRMVNQLAQKKGVTLALDVDLEIDQIWADERRLKQMLVNLLSNAVKFTTPGGKIGLEVRGDHRQERVSFTVWDSGIGIAGEDLGRLFQPFVQLDSHLDAKASGTGLGLALVAQMARLHGGSVSVISQPDQGSRFTIALPWLSVPAPAMTGLTSGPAVPPDLSGLKDDQRTILLVEDAEATITVVRDYLEHAGFRVAVARNGREGIALARRLRPSLILMDVQMPILDGLDTVRLLRQEPEHAHTPIIALTALALENDRERCLAAGMDDYIAKPVNLHLLIRSIANLLLSRGGASTGE
ncbi:MAG: PAS domain S-box protein [Caldilinea sp.]|nr:PAS domain S-box protein [Caldilinea sp.]